MIINVIANVIINVIINVITNVIINVVINLHRCSCTVSIILVTFLWNLNFLDMFSQNIEILNFMTIRLVGVELFHADEGRTDGWTNRQT